VTLALLLLPGRDRDPLLSTFCILVRLGLVGCDAVTGSASDILCRLSSTKTASSFAPAPLSWSSRSVWVTSQDLCCFARCTCGTATSPRPTSPSSMCTAALATGARTRCAEMNGISLLSCAAFIATSVCSWSSNGPVCPSKGSKASCTSEAVAVCSSCSIYCTLPSSSSHT
jgi:hypothetical protein